MKSSTGGKRNKYIQTGYSADSKPQKIDVVVPMRSGVHLPRVPHFIQTTEGTWLPLCALSKEGLEELGKRWTEVMVERAKEQAKDANHFFSVAANRHSRTQLEHEASEKVKEVKEEPKPEKPAHD